MNTLTSSEFYDRLADLFDVMTDWRSRLAFGLPFLQQTLNDHAAHSVLDVACGRCRHRAGAGRLAHDGRGCQPGDDCAGA